MSQELEIKSKQLQDVQRHRDKQDQPKITNLTIKTKIAN